MTGFHPERTDRVVPPALPDQRTVVACAALFAVYDDRWADAKEKVAEMDPVAQQELVDNLIDLLVLVRTGRQPPV